MKLRTIKNTFEKFFLATFVVLMSGFAVACSDDDAADTTSIPFDPSQPVVITGFTPESGGYQEQIIVYGQNFGTDKSELTLTIGGKKAVVVNIMSDKLYAYVPSGAFSGEVEITITHDGNEYTAKSDKVFQYERKTVVGTLCGYKNSNDDQGEMWGSFDVCCGFNNEGCLNFDPLYPERLYVTYDYGGYIAELNLETREAKRLMSATKFQSQRLRNVAFSLDGKYMLVSTDRNDNGTKSTSVWIVTRSGDGTFSDKSSCQVLVSYRQCNGVAVHPVNGEVYFNSYENGQLFSFTLEDYFAAVNGTAGDGTSTWTGYYDDGCYKELFKIQDPSYEFQIDIHPSGKYAYLVVINRHYILRTDYDEKKHEFTTPYVVAGSNGSSGWVDAVGTTARVSRPYQGVFVKNPDYVAEGREDQYDFYFADCTNFCVRYITPDGLVRTYAGHSPSTDGNIWGTEDGDLRQAARFRDVTGLAYNEQTETFYVLDHNNRRIRTIGKESEETIEITTPEEGTTDNGSENN